MARVAEVGVHATVSTVSPTAAGGGTVDNNPLYEEVVNIHTGIRVGLGIGLGVLEEAENKFDRLDGPATLASGVTLVLSLGGAADLAGKLEERDAPLALLNSLKVALGLLDGLTDDSHRGLVGVLERNTEVGPLGLHTQGGDTSEREVRIEKLRVEEFDWDTSQRRQTQRPEKQIVRENQGNGQKVQARMGRPQDRTEKDDREDFMQPMEYNIFQESQPQTYTIQKSDMTESEP